MKKLLTLMLASGALIGTATIATACNNNGSALAERDQKIEELEAEIANLTSAKANLESTVATLESAKTTLEAQVASKNVEISNLEQAKSDLQSQVTTLTTAKADLEEQVRTLTTEKQNLEDLLAASNGQNDELTSQKLALEAEITRLNGVNATLDAQITTLNNINAKLSADLAEAKNLETALRSVISRLDTDLKAAKVTITNLNKTIADLEAKYLLGMDDDTLAYITSLERQLGMTKHLKIAVGNDKVVSYDLAKAGIEVPTEWDGVSGNWAGSEVIFTYANGKLFIGKASKMRVINQEFNVFDDAVDYNNKHSLNDAGFEAILTLKAWEDTELPPVDEDWQPTEPTPPTPVDVVRPVFGENHLDNIDAIKTAILAEKIVKFSVHANHFPTMGVTAWNSKGWNGTLAFTVTDGVLTIGTPSAMATHGMTLPTGTVIDEITDAFDWNEIYEYFINSPYPEFK